MQEINLYPLSGKILDVPDFQKRCIILFKKLTLYFFRAASASEYVYVSIFSSKYIGDILLLL